MPTCAHVLIESGQVKCRCRLAVRGRFLVSLVRVSLMAAAVLAMGRRTRSLQHAPCDTYDVFDRGICLEAETEREMERSKLRLPPSLPFIPSAFHLARRPSTLHSISPAFLFFSLLIPRTSQSSLSMIQRQSEGPAWSNGLAVPHAARASRSRWGRASLGWQQGGGGRGAGFTLRLRVPPSPC